MAGADTWFMTRLNREWLVHSVRTTIAAIASLYIARLAGLPEAYWATITTIIVTQSTLGAALKPSWYRFVGTALGVAAGALAATYFGTNTMVFALGIFVLGLVCAMLRLDRNAYRFAGTALAIVVLASHEKAAWVAALHRFIEVSIGIVVGLVITAAWPEKEADATATAKSQ
jgi:uncharacterized membrane protein YgaE (UPF0421/DUF939 family)